MNGNRKHRSPRFKTMIPVLALILACMGLYLHPAPAADSASHEPALILRIYDVSDLVTVFKVDPSTTAVVPPTEASTKHIDGSPRKPSGDGSVGTNQTASDRAAELAAIIQRTIDPNSWRDNGGSEGSIQTFGVRLIVNASAANHKQIEQFLADLRQKAPKCIHLRAAWLALSDEELQSVRGSMAEGAIDLEAAEKIKGALKDRAEIVALSGQRVNVTSGRARLVLSGADLIVGNGAAGFQPNLDLLLSGVALQIAPVLSADGARVAVDLRAVLCRWDENDLKTIRIPGPAAAAAQPNPNVNGPVAAAQPNQSGNGPVAAVPSSPLEVQRITAPVHLIATAANLPVGRPTLVGSAALDLESGKPRTIYLVLQATVDASK